MRNDLWLLHWAVVVPSCLVHAVDNIVPDQVSSRPPDGFDLHTATDGAEESYKNPVRPALYQSKRTWTPEVELHCLCFLSVPHILAT